MKRKGTSLSFYAFMIALVVGFSLASNFLFHQYVSTLEGNAESASKSQYVFFGLREEVMNAECITEQRGVFIQEQLETPDALSCIGPAEDEITVRFQWTEGAGSDTDLSGPIYTITPQGPGEPSDVSDNLLDQIDPDTFWDQFTTSREYPIIVYDSETDQYHQGAVIIAA